MFAFVLGCVIGLVGLVTVFGGALAGKPARPAQYGDTDRWGRQDRVAAAQRSTRGPVIGFGLLLMLLAGIIIGLDSFTTIAARGVGVQTAFGKVRGHTLGPGFHGVAPWANVEEFDGSVQTLKYYQAEKKDDGDCLTVRLGNNTQACVDVTTQWQINYRGNVKELYLQYKTFDNIHDNLVRRQLGSALNEVFGTYDPLASVDTKTDTPTVNTKQLQDKVKLALQGDLGTGILIDSVTIPIVHFDPDTENRLHLFQAAKADTRIAEQQRLTADAQAQANKALAEQPAISNPGVQYQNCLNTTRELAKSDQLKNLPPTWNCNQGAPGTTLVQAR